MNAVPARSVVTTASRKAVLGLVACLGLLPLGLTGRFRPADAASTPAIAIIECTAGNALRFGCFEQRYDQLTRTAGPDAALRDLEQARQTSGFLVAACHQLTHRIGRLAGELDGKAAYGHGGTLCASGFYHGVSEAVMAQMGPELAEHDASSVCADQRDRIPGSNTHYNCIHGMGHGFMGVFQSDMFRSLAACDTLGDAWEEEQCYGGVFMENMSALEHPTRPTSKNLRADEPLYPCTAVQPHMKTPCYEKQTAYALYIANDDFARVFELCAATPEHEFRLVCFQGLGGDAAIHASKYIKVDDDQVRAIGTLCGVGPDAEARANCFGGAVRTTIRDLGRDDSRSERLCAGLEEPAANRLCHDFRERAKAELLTKPAVTQPHDAH